MEQVVRFTTIAFPESEHELVEASRPISGRLAGQDIAGDDWLNMKDGTKYARVDV